MDASLQLSSTLYLLLPTYSTSRSLYCLDLIWCIEFNLPTKKKQITDEVTLQMSVNFNLFYFTNFLHMYDIKCA